MFSVYLKHFSSAYFTDVEDFGDDLLYNLSYIDINIWKAAVWIYHITLTLTLT